MLSLSQNEAWENFLGQENQVGWRLLFQFLGLWGLASFGGSDYLEDRV